MNKLPERRISFVEQGDWDRGRRFKSVPKELLDGAIAVTAKRAVYMCFGAIKGTREETVKDPYALVHEPYRLGAYYDPEWTGQWVRIGSATKEGQFIGIERSRR